jgi:hypothetical protein
MSKRKPCGRYPEARGLQRVYLQRFDPMVAANDDDGRNRRRR